MEQENALLRSVLNAIPSPLFIVEEDVRVMGLNTAAFRLQHGGMSDVVGRRCGDVLRCIHSLETPEGCGRSSHCADCVIRNGVKAALKGESTHRQRFRMELAEATGDIPLYILVTAAPLDAEPPGRVLLMIEDISSVMVMHGIVCVCSRCKRLRDDDKYWHNMEGYFRSQWDLDVSHGYCPECTRELLKEVAATEVDGGA